MGRERTRLVCFTGVTAALMLMATPMPVAANPNAGEHSPAPQAHGPVAMAGVGGIGGFGGQGRIEIPAGTISPAHPLRVMLIGDSVMGDAELGIVPALSATGEATSFSHAIVGFGLAKATNWPTEFPLLIAQEHPQLVIGTWSWDFAGPTTPNALYDPRQYTALLERFLRTVLAPGDGVDGVMLLEFPPWGPVADPTPSKLASERIGAMGRVAWNRIASEMPSVFPGRVMYLPVADSILFNGQYSTWLPPLGDPSAPKDQWVRVRKLDKTHMCPQGSARLGIAIDADLRMIVGLAPPEPPLWFTGPWTTNPQFNEPTGACPHDHPATAHHERSRK